MLQITIQNHSAAASGEVVSFAGERKAANVCARELEAGRYVVCGVELGSVGWKSSSAAGCELVKVGARNVR